jgi:hypothetical protein
LRSQTRIGGEAGCAGALVSVMNAVVDALAERGVRRQVDPNRSTCMPYARPQNCAQATGGGRGKELQVVRA